MAPKITDEYNITKQRFGPKNPELLSKSLTLNGNWFFDFSWVT